MAKKKNQKPFNLLYRSQLQKDSIDQMYEFVTGPGRIIVVLVMFSIIVAFLYRFPLDAKLNNEVNKALDISKELDRFSGDLEQQFAEVEGKTEAAKKYISLYKDTSLPKDEISSSGEYYKISEFLPILISTIDSFGDDIVVASYSYNPNGQAGGEISFSGFVSSFSQVDDLKEDIIALDKYVLDAINSSISADAESVPQFNMQVILNE